MKDISIEDASVVIYIADVLPLNDDGLFGRIYSSVSDERRNKTDSLRSRKDKNLSLGVEYLLMHSCRKPYFNLSHSGGKAVCAVSDYPVGCDVEHKRNISMNIASRFFCEEEIRLIESQGNEDLAREMFFRLWVLKESFMKCTRLGFALPLNGFSVLPDGDEILLKQSVDTDGYSFYEYTCDDSYRYACCVKRGEKVDVQWKQVAIE